jgi:disulfide bond formation protein DsbB
MRSEMDGLTKPVLAKPPRPVMAASALVLAIAAATILAALAFEQLGGYAACPLCLQERYAYYFAVPASAIALVLARGHATGLARVLLLLIALAFLVNAVAGIYHAGIEWKWWEGPAACAGGTPIEWGVGGLAEQLENAQVISCDEASWRFLWLSFAGWNAVISAFLAAISAWGATQKR